MIVACSDGVKLHKNVNDYPPPTTVINPCNDFDSSACDSKGKKYIMPDIICL